LTSRLKKIKNIFNELGIDSFIWLLDTKKKRENVRNIIDEIYQQIQETDGIVCYIDNKEKSEGMFLELGM
jgi:predicted enzyme involved in methoxymalonyl-ACP biosynthesis